MMSFTLETTLNGVGGKMNFSVEGEIQKGQFLCLKGPSGAGKTTLLRMLAGLRKAENGKIFFSDRCWLDTEKKLFLPPQKRKIAFVFQDYALFPNMSVRENLYFPMGKEKDEQLVEELLEMMELTSLQHQKPGKLSGGQQQRVALARALAFKPNLLLLDEPLAALDQVLRIQLQTYLSEVHQRFQLTTIMVSHDEQEISKLADEVWIMEEGTIIQRGKPEEVLAPTQIKLIGRVKEVIQKDGYQEVVLTSGPNEWKLRRRLGEYFELGEEVEVMI
ncbi:MAG: ATP-binding cassette domain-containing protein [Bacteroidota bacterium]